MDLDRATRWHAQVGALDENKVANQLELVNQAIREESAKRDALKAQIESAKADHPSFFTHTDMVRHELLRCMKTVTARLLWLAHSLLIDNS